MVSFKWPCVSNFQFCFKSLLKARSLTSPFRVKFSIVRSVYFAFQIRRLSSSLRRISDSQCRPKSALESRFSISYLLFFTFRIVDFASNPFCVPILDSLRMWCAQNMMPSSHDAYRRWFCEDIMLSGHASVRTSCWQHLILSGHNARWRPFSTRESLRTWCSQGLKLRTSIPILQRVSISRTSRQVSTQYTHWWVTEPPPVFSWMIQVLFSSSDR
jgi:hypothetical protein